MPQNASATITTTASPETVFKHLAVAEAWPKWIGLPTKARRARAGAPDPNGVGAVRAIFPVRERVVAYEPGAHYAYVMISPSPMKNYRADVRLTPKGGGTLIEYSAQADAAIPGTDKLIAASLRFATKKLSRGLAKHTERCAPGCPGHAG